MTALDQTLEQTQHDSTPAGAATPGIVIIYDAGAPSRQAFPVSRSGLTLGRGTPDGVLATDDRVSRRHVTISCAQGAWAVNDLASRNGTFVNGRKIEGYVDYDAPVLVRVGRSLIWAVNDVTPYLDAPAPQPTENGIVVGGLLRRAWQEIALASRAGDTLLVRGETGSGKELAAKELHEVCFGKNTTAPFVAVNCATIPEGLAERLLFGAKRGAYSGASDAQGFIAAAHLGTLFLDEIAELDPLVQAKLLRVLETREVVPLGEARARPVQIRVCAASHQNLRDEVSRGRFREDLYFRIGRPEVVLPPLRARVDEIPWLIQAEVQRAGGERTASVGFVEACALRPWPGNVRELLREVRIAAHSPPDPGSNAIEAHHLPHEAGQLIAASNEPERDSRSSTAAQSAAAQTTAQLSTERIERALSEHAGNVTRAASALGLHRNQLRRWLAKKAPGDPGSAEGTE